MGLRNCGSNPRRGRVQTGSWTYLASCSMGSGCTFLGVKWPVREADHPPPSSTDVKDEWCSNSTPPYAFVACTGSLYFNLYFFLNSVTLLRFLRQFIVMEAIEMRYIQG